MSEAIEQSVENAGGEIEGKSSVDVNEKASAGSVIRTAEHRNPP
jgi:hypothetical protein